MKHALLSISLISCVLCCANAQPSRFWDKTYGGHNWDEMHVLLQTSDGGFLLGGNVTGSGGEVTGPTFGYNDYWILKTDASGNRLWDKTYGGTGNDLLWAILPLDDGGYLLGGHSTSDSSGNKLTHGYGKDDFWLVKIDASGEKNWERTIGGSQADKLFALAAGQDSTWILGGFSDSGADGEKTTDSLGMTDVWVLKIDFSGKIIWQKTFGGDKLENLYDLVPTPDGGFLLGCASASGITPTKSQSSRGLADFWVIKINTDGEQEWDKRFGGNDVEQLEQILPLRDGNYLLLGASMSQASGERTAPNRGSFDFWALKMDSLGNKIWDNAYGGSKFDGAFRAVETRSGHIYLAGASDSPVSGTKKSPPLGDYDYWLVYLDPSGKQIWEKGYGGKLYDSMTGLVQTADGSLLLAGHAASPASSYKSENPRGYNDFWVMKTWCDVAVTLPADTSLCSGAPVQFKAKAKNCFGGDCDFHWFDGSETTEISLKPDSLGHIFLFVEDGIGCLSEDTLHYQLLSAPHVALGPDTTIFEEGSNLLLDVFQNGNLTYQWNVGSKDPDINVSKSGIYRVTVTADNGCTASDDIAVCACAKRVLYIPNVFQPDLDVYNDLWYVHARAGAVEELELIEVYDNWGHRVFRAEHALPNDKTYAWDGFDRGRRCIPGVYTYAIKVRYTDFLTEIIYGTVALIR